MLGMPWMLCIKEENAGGTDFYQLITSINRLAQFLESARSHLELDWRHVGN